MAITYNATDNIITLDGANTYSFEDIYNADQSGGWGVVSKQGDDQYFIEANITLGDGSNETQLIDEDCAIQLGTNANQRWMETKANSVFRLTTSYFEWYPPSVQKRWDGKTYFYNSSLYKRGDATWHAPSVYNDIEILNCYLDFNSFFIGAGNFKTTIKESIFSLNNKSFEYGSSGECDIDDLTVKNALYGIKTAVAKKIIFKNCKFSSNTYDIYLSVDNNELELINSIFDKNKLLFEKNSNILYDKFEFDIKVIDKNNNPLTGAIVKLYDKNNNLIFEEATDENGKISTHEVLYRKFEGTSETETLYTPHTLKITKDGYTDYEAKITIDHKIEDDVFVLDALTYTYDDIMKMLKAIYVK